MPALPDLELVSPVPRRERSQPAHAWLHAGVGESEPAFEFRLPVTEAARQEDSNALDDLIVRAFEKGSWELRLPVNEVARQHDARSLDKMILYVLETRQTNCEVQVHTGGRATLNMLEGVLGGARPVLGALRVLAGQLSYCWEAGLRATFAYPRVLETTQTVSVVHSQDSELERMLEQSRRILDVPGGQYALETWKRAESMLRDLYESAARRSGGFLPVPQIQPAEEGSIDLYWPNLPLTVLVNVPSSPSEPITYSAGLRGAEQTFGGALEPRDVALRLLALVIMDSTDEQIPG